MWLGALLLIAGVAGAQPKSPSLTPQQAKWLRDHPVITVGLYSSDALPFEGFQNGQAEGYSYDYLKAIAEELGLHLRVRKYGSLAEEIDAACRGEIDVLMNLVITAERTQCLAFTQPYMQVPGALVTRIDDESVAANPRLAGLYIAMEQGFSTREAVHEIYPNAIALEADNSVAALRMVASGRADVYVGNPYLIDALIKRFHIKGLRLAQQNELPLSKLHFAVPHAQEPLAGALDAAMAALPGATRQALERHWLPTPSWTAGHQPSLTPDEASTLAKPLRLGFVAQWAPISFVDDKGEPSGLAGEYLRHFRETGAHVQIVPVKDLADLSDKIRDGGVDAVIGIPRGMPMAEGWASSRPFITVADVIVTREDAGPIRDIHDLGQSRVAIAGVERLAPQVLAQAPNARIVYARNVYEGLALVDRGQADAYVGNLAVVDQLIQKHYSGNLRIAAPASINDDLVFASAPAFAADVAVFDRTLAMMSPRERAALRGSWIGLDYRSGIDWHAVARRLSPIVLALLTVAFIAALGYWRLRREVAERRRAENRLAKITGNLPAVVYQLRRAPDGTFSFPYIAGDISSMFGATVEDAVRDERYLFSLVHPEDRPSLQQALERAAVAMDNIAIDFRVMSHSGWRWIRSRGRLHDSHEGTLLWSGYWVDITEARMKAEELVAAKAEAERAAAAKAEFLATMSHEIRTPMSGVLGMLEVLEHTGLDEEQRRALETIEDSAQMLRQIIDDILDLSKIEAGALALDATPVQLRQIVDNVQQMLSPLAAGRQLRIANSIDTRVAQVHLADGTRLRQILFNLLSNAIKFTERGGVTLLLTLLQDTTEEQRLLLSVIDTGIGMSTEQQERLFQPFSQAEASTQRHYGGTGLGLNICRRLVKLMKGTIRLESAPGRGTRVDVMLHLPVCPGLTAMAGESAPLPAPSAMDLSGTRVLVAEDHPTNQTLMQWRMSQLGTDCHIVANGAEALEALRHADYAIVITDCHMPVLDGYGFARARRREEAGEGLARVPIIALTASAVSGESDQCRDAGIDDFLVKPVSLVELQEAMARWLPDGARHVGDACAPAEPTQMVAAGHARQELLRRLGSAELVDDIIRSLAPAMREDIRALRRAVADGRTTMACETLHRTLGAIDSIGEVALAEHARDLMHAIESDGLDDYGEAIEAFIDAVEAYAAALTAPAP
jgi:two-component system sensor histidine kinase EvgS